MNYKQIAEETLSYINAGNYLFDGKVVDFSAMQAVSLEQSTLLEPTFSAMLLEKNIADKSSEFAKITVVEQSTVQTILDLRSQGIENIGVLNFASAKNPGGGFLNGAMAQEESLAISSGLYATQIRNKAYYEINRAHKSMMYKNYAIYSPDVVFFRDEKFALIEHPVTASVLTMPAVNYGQVICKGENPIEAKKVMRDRMKRVLAILAHFGDKNIILGAYGCGVFRNDPVEVAQWWQELLFVEEMGRFFDSITFAVLDNSKKRMAITAFANTFSGRGRDV